MTPSEEALQGLAEYLAERTRDRQDARARQASADDRKRKASSWKLFLTWLGENVASATFIVTVVTAAVTGIWTFRRRGKGLSRVREGALC
jgi:hypothetical protein